jgi:ABC-type dipeptide/oligopeptide/nickel transport system ATPase subunit
MIWGEIRINGTPVLFRSPADAIRAGIGMIHQHFMLIPTMTVAENVALGRRSSRGIRLDLGSSLSILDESAASPVPARPVSRATVSASLPRLWRGYVRELSRRPTVFVASQPTRGVDIGASEYIHRTLPAQRDAGTAILLISEDLDEIRELSDRVAVIYAGQHTSRAREPQGAAGRHGPAGKRPRPLSQDLFVEVVDEPVDFAHTFLNPQPVLAVVPLGLELFHVLPLLLDPGVVLEIVDAKPFVVGQFERVVDGLPLEGTGDRPRGAHLIQVPVPLALLGNP